MIGRTALFPIPLLGSVLIAVVVLKRSLRRGQRTGSGRTPTDQVEGFGTYLATAEADQLRLEDDEDIFSRYLPWAVLLDLTDRWTKVCGELRKAGWRARLPPGITARHGPWTVTRTRFRR